MFGLAGLLGIASSGSNTDPLAAQQFQLGQQQLQAQNNQFGAGLLGQSLTTNNTGAINWQQMQNALQPSGYTFTLGTTATDIAKEVDLTKSLLEVISIILLMYLGLKRTDKLMALIYEDKRIQSTLNMYSPQSATAAILLGYQDYNVLRKTLYPIVQNVCFDLFIIKKAHEE